MTFKKIHLWRQGWSVVCGQTTAYITSFPLFLPGQGEIWGIIWLWLPTKLIYGTSPFELYLLQIDWFFFSIMNWNDWRMTKPPGKFFHAGPEMLAEYHYTSPRNLPPGPRVRTTDLTVGWGVSIRKSCYLWMHLTLARSSHANFVDWTD